MCHPLFSLGHFDFDHKSLYTSVGFMQGCVKGVFSMLHGTVFAHYSNLSLLTLTRLSLSDKH
ncbi:hypothetical protein SPWS13_1390 [Shewanella putrefaciens]|nr:hypothetical protein SPWS13_1390 [Shewanella putrefaciens]